MPPEALCGKVLTEESLFRFPASSNWLTLRSNRKDGGPTN